MSLQKYMKVLLKMHIYYYFNLQQVKTALLTVMPCCVSVKGIMSEFIILPIPIWDISFIETSKCFECGISHLLLLLKILSLLTKKKKKRGFQNFNLNLYISLQKVKQEHESSKGTLNILLLRYDFILFFKDFKDLSKTSANQPTKY